MSSGFESLAAGWAAAMGRACWQGGIVLLLVWAVGRLFPRLPGDVRCWLWRLAYLKLVVTLVWTGPVTLPVLPARPAGAPTVPPLGPALSTVALPRAPSPVPAPLDALAGLGSRPAPPDSRAGPLVSRSRSPGLPPPQPPRPSAAATLMMLWGVGVIGCGARITRQWWRVRQLCRRCEPLADAALAQTVGELCGPLGLRRPPGLTVGPVATPALVGLRRPTILLPAGLGGGTTPAALRLVMAHELAHLQRRDLAWGWLSILAHALFFFHPLVWLAHAECRLAQEIACDETAVRCTQVPVAEYGEMLVSLAARRRGGEWDFSAVGALDPGRTLERRLTMLEYLGSRSPAAVVRTGGVIAALALLGLAPWRVTAQTAAPAKPPDTGSGLSNKIDTMNRIEPKVPSHPSHSVYLVQAPPSEIRYPISDIPQSSAVPAKAPTARLDGAQTGMVWEEMLLLEATRYLRMSEAQLRQLLALAQEVGARLTRLQAEEEQSLAALHQIALRQREALLAGRNSSSREQANALSLRETIQRRRAEAETEIVQYVVPRLARLLTPAQTERAFLLAHGLTPEGETPELALLDPAAGFVTKEKLGQPIRLNVMNAAPGGAPVAAAPAGGLAQQLIAAQQRLLSTQQALLKMNMANEMPGAVVMLRPLAGAPGEVRAPDVIVLDKLKLAIAAEQQDLKLRSIEADQALKQRTAEEQRALALNKMETARQHLQENLQQAQGQVVALRRQLFHPAGAGAAVSPEEFEALLPPLARRLFLSPRFPTVLTERLRATP